MADLSLADALNRQFGISGLARVLSGNGGLPKLEVTTKSASAEIYLHGAQVTSWQPAGAEEVIFLSRHSHWEDGRAIRGGIPVCFPWFRAKADDPKAPAHGFARTREWQLDSVIAEEDGSAIAVLSTESDASTRRWWPYEFRLALRIMIGSTLGLELTATNTGSAPFSFEEALHTYFRVGQATSVRVRGLNGVNYLDNVDQNREKTQSGDLVLTGTTDNAYGINSAPALLTEPPATCHRPQSLAEVRTLGSWSGCQPCCGAAFQSSTRHGWCTCSGRPNTSPLPQRKIAFLPFLYLPAASCSR